MSLDVYLTVPPDNLRPGRWAIFVRGGGATEELTLDEWTERFGDRQPVLCWIAPTEKVYSANITHNLGKMADAAGLYEALWRPDECGVETASQLVGPLERGLAALEADPDRFRALNPANGWGSYEGLVRFVHAYLEACREHLQARVTVSR